jgi:hypothetical protein
MMETEQSWADISDELDRSEKSCQSRWDRLLHDRLVIEVEEETDTPTKQELFRFMADKPRTITELCNKWDRSPDVIRLKIAELKADGYEISETQDRTSIAVASKPEGQSVDDALADLEGQEFSIAIASDLHVGSRHSQPTQHAAFIRKAYEDFGVRHIINPGDTFAGVFGYRGQTRDLMPYARPTGRSEASAVVDKQVWLADKYYPRLDGLQYYNLGGNHDYWHISVTGRNGVKIFCDQREDMKYLGYDVASVPLSDKAHIRVWHPTGGVPYAVSYRLQKGMEGNYKEAMQEAINQDEVPITSMLIAGHLHIAVFLPTLPIMGLHPGCYEAQSNYLKKKGLFPDLGGTILKLRLGDDGKVKWVNYIFIPALEIKDDWKNWPLPDMEDTDYDVDDLDALYSVENPSAGSEYVGGR